MSIRLYTEVRTQPIDEPSIMIDACLAAGQAALIAPLFSIASAGAGAIFGLALRIAYKINEWVLNVIFEQISKKLMQGVGVSLLRKIVEVTAAAALVGLACWLLIPSVSLSFADFLVLSALEDLRPVRSGSSVMSGNVLERGLVVTISCRYRLVI